MSPSITPIADKESDLALTEQLITPEGARRAHALLDPYVADVTLDQLRELYRDMSIVRRIDAEGIALQRQGQLGLWAPCQGQEAAQVGTARALRRDDMVFPSYREVGVLYTRDAEPGDFVRVWRG
ncbi:pyruvate dehydrogenase, partial [Bacillus toyonensis]|nr:pyruvate dehydrogenase [Bacillus toyonensis]